MTKREFKKAVETNEIEGLKQPKSFMQQSVNHKKAWEEYKQEIKEQAKNYDQVLYSIAVEPSMKEAIRLAGKNRGKTKGGAKAIVREALISYFNRHPDSL